MGGFAEPQNNAIHGAKDAPHVWLKLSDALLTRRRCPKLVAACEKLARHCCPADWHERVLREEDAKRGITCQAQAASTNTLVTVPVALARKDCSVSLPLLPVLEPKTLPNQQRETGTRARGTVLTAKESVERPRSEHRLGAAASKMRAVRTPVGADLAFKAMTSTVETGSHSDILCRSHDRVVWTDDRVFVATPKDLLRRRRQELS